MELIHKYFGDIKIKRRDDGTIDVYGKATGPDLDLDQQICDPEWLATAVPEWLKSAGNVRAMHQPIAAGVGFELEEIDQSWWLKSNIVDADSILKCDKRVYKGYSIGIANAVVITDKSAPGGRIIKGDIVEISLVDRPANPTALMDICKMTTVDGIELLGLVTKDTSGLVGSSPETEDGVEPPTVVTAEPCPDCSAGIVNDEACATCGGTGLTKAPVVKAPEIVAMIKALFELRKSAGFVAKFVAKDATPLHDVVLLNTIRQGLITCLITELNEAAGGEDERWDIEDLSWILASFTSWWSNEAWEGEVAGPFAGADEGEEMSVFVSLGVKPELLKAASDEGATDEQRAEARVEIAKALGLGEVVELTALLKQATEGAKALEDRLATVEEMSAPGGPALRATANQKMKSEDVDRLRDEAKKFMDAATLLEDPERKRHYIGKAAQANRDADALERV